MLIEDLKDYVVVRVDERAGWSRELYGESELEGEAIRFAGMLASFEGEEGVSFEVRTSRGYGLVYSTAEEEPLTLEGAARWRQRCRTWSSPRRGPRSRSSGSWTSRTRSSR